MPLQGRGHRRGHEGHADVRRGTREPRHGWDTVRQLRHRFAQTLRRDEDDVAGAGKEVELEHGVDDGAINPLGPGPVELRHGGEAAEAAAEQTAFEAPARAFLLFALDEVLEDRQAETAPAEQLRTMVAGYGLHDLDAYWSSLAPFVAAIGVHLDSEEWL